MRLYDYDQYTKELIGYREAREDPMQKGVYLLPAHATFLEPPTTVPKGKVIIFSEEKGIWVAVKDRRGKYWDTKTQEEHVIELPGIDPEETWVDIEPTDREAVWTGVEWKVSFEVLKDRKIAQIRIEADIALASMKENFSGAEYESWPKQEAGANALDADPESTDMNAVFVRRMAEARGIPVDVLVGKILVNVENYATAFSTILGNQQRREDLVKAATTEEELANI